MGDKSLVDRAGLVALDDLTARVGTDLFVVTMPGGELETWHTERNEAVVWAFSRIGLLVESCGNGQPYVRVSASRLAEVLAGHGAVFVSLDMRHPDGVRYPEPEPDELSYADELPDEYAAAAALWVPSEPVRARDQRVDLELHRDEAGRPMLLVYSSLERLRAGCGPHQAAVAIETDRVGQVARQLGVAGIVLNGELPEQARHAEPVRPGRTKTDPIEGQDNRGRRVGPRSTDRH
jgi:hypothetical protein